MSRILFALAVVAITSAPIVAQGHGIPIYVTIAGGRIVAELPDSAGTALVPSSSFGGDLDFIGAFGGEQLTTELPGIGVALGDHSIPDGTQLAISVLSKLTYSSGPGAPVTAASSGISLEIDNSDADFRIATGTTDYLPPITVAAYAASSNPGNAVPGDPIVPAWHQHFVYTVSPALTASGGYGILAQIMSPNHPDLAPSAPFALIFNNDLSDATFAQLQTQMTKVILSTGDLNQDYIVDVSDIQTLAQNWGTNHAAGDANHDGVVDISDIQTIAQNWLHTIGPGPGGYFPPTMVPEPSGLALALPCVAGVIAVIRARQRPERARNTDPARIAT